MSDQYVKYPIASSVPSSAFPLLAPNGTAGAPSYSFSGDATTGMYHSGSNTIGFSTSGVLRLFISPTLILSSLPFAAPSGTVSLPAYGNTTTKTGIYFSGESILFSCNQALAGQFNASGQFSALGITANTAASAGQIGEIISTSVTQASAVSLVTGTPKTIMSVSLTQGWWCASGLVQFKPGGSTSIVDLAISVNTTDNAFAGSGNRGNPSATGQIEIERASAAYVPGGPIDMAIPPYNFYVASPVTYYLVAQGFFSVSTLAAGGFLQFERYR